MSDLRHFPSPQIKLAQGLGQTAVRGAKAVLRKARRPTPALPNRPDLRPTQRLNLGRTQPMNTQRWDAGIRADVAPTLPTERLNLGRTQPMRLPPAPQAPVTQPLRTQPAKVMPVPQGRGPVPAGRGPVPRQELDAVLGASTPDDSWMSGLLSPTARRGGAGKSEDWWRNAAADAVERATRSAQPRSSAFLNPRSATSANLANTSANPSGVGRALANPDATPGGYARIGAQHLGGTIEPRRTSIPASDYTGPATGAATPSAKNVQKAPPETAQNIADTHRTIGPDTMGSQIFGGPSGNTFVDRGPAMMGSGRLSNSQVGPSGPSTLGGGQAAATAQKTTAPRSSGPAPAKGEANTRQTGRVDLQDTRRTGAPADMPSPGAHVASNDAPPPRSTANNAPPLNRAAGSTYFDPASMGPAPQANQPFTGISGTSSTGPAPAATPSPSVVVDPALAGPPPGGGTGGTGGGGGGTGPAPAAPGDVPADAQASPWTLGNAALVGAGFGIPGTLGYLLGDASGSADEQARMAQAGLAGGALGMMGPPLLQGQYF